MEQKNLSTANHTTHCRIFLRQMSISCKIGIDPAEQQTPQKLILDVEITPAADDASSILSVDYAAVFYRLQTFAAAKQHTLLETFAAEVADILLNEFAIAAVRVVCEKPRPFAGLGGAAAEIVRTK
ncbi:MAG: dihydroneopterin aldolase [Gammaproteobacteria bacterium WSBS_2016_MAG_OTU1]